MRIKNICSLPLELFHAISTSLSCTPTHHFLSEENLHHRQSSGIESPHEPCSCCKCRRSCPCPGCAVHTTEPWLTTSPAVMKRTRSAFPWLSSRTHLVHPSGHSSWDSQGQRWEQDSPLMVDCAAESQRKPGKKGPQCKSRQKVIDF